MNGFLVKHLMALMSFVFKQALIHKSKAKSLGRKATETNKSLHFWWLGSRSKSSCVLANSGPQEPHPCLISSFLLLSCLK